MTPTGPNLDAYCARIGYDGSREPSLATLQALQRLHPRAIPFENLDVLLGRPIQMDLAAVEEKLVRQRRGGYCFEQNTLFGAVLRAMGFAVTPLLARVRWQVPAEVAMPLTHMVLRVDVDGRPWLADVGFGSVGVTGPLALDVDTVQATPHDARRIVSRRGALAHQLQTPDGWGDVYEFTNEPPPLIDFELGNWFSCTHPKARFTNNLVVARVLDDRRILIFNREFTIRPVGGAVEQRLINSPDELLSILAHDFGLHFPAGTRFGQGRPDVPWPT